MALMDPALKHRLIGAAVLSALAIIFLPMLIVDRDKNSIAADVPLNVPSTSGGDFQTRELPLVAPASGVPDGGVVGMDASHPAAPAAASSASPAVDANGQPRPTGVLPASSSSSAAAAPTITPPTVPVVSANAASPAVTPTAAAASTAAATPASPAGAAPSAPIPAASAGGHYVVSLGTYSNAANAQSLVASLKGSQLPAYAEPVSVAGKMQTRVRIGPFAQRGDAEAARLKAQQVRTDMPASVTALDAAAPAVDAPVMPTNKPAPAPTPAIVKSATTPTAMASKPVVPVSTTSASTKTAPPATSAAALAATRPSAPSPAATGRGYAVQVSAFPSEDKALTLRDKLRAAGFTAFSERIQAESGVMYRVRVGPEADRDAADRLRAELSTKMGMNGMVVGYP
jgi:cell division septation protein DedD